MRLKPTDEIPVTADGQERRSLRTPIEFRESDDGGATISGYAAVIGQETVIGGGEWSFREVIEPGAFDDAVGRDDVRALFNHNPDILLGRTQSETLRLKADTKGLRYDVDLPDTVAAKDVRTLIKRGDVSGSSFAFRVEDDEWEEGKTDKKSGTRTLPLRRIRKVELFDVSPVTYPAYPQTSVSARSKAQAAAGSSDLARDGVTVVLQMDGRRLAEALVPVLPVQPKSETPEQTEIATARAKIALARAKVV